MFSLCAGIAEQWSWFQIGLMVALWSVALSLVWQDKGLVKHRLVSWRTWHLAWMGVVWFGFVVALVMKGWK